MPETAALRAVSFGATDQGPRPNNEDEFHCDDERGIYFVIDGMGGYAGGEQAAAIAKARLKGRLERASGTPEERIREAITLANNEIYEQARARPEWKGMACVLTAAVLEEGEFTIGHVGDSRLYRVTARGIQKITKDHSPVGRQEDAGEISEAQAMSHPRRNEVFRDVGSQRHDANDPAFIDIHREPFRGGTALLFCSDGLSDTLSSARMFSIIASSGNREAIVNNLLDAAVKEAKDNVTAVFVQVAPSSRPLPAASNGGIDVGTVARPIPLAAGSTRTRIALAVGGLALGCLLTLATESFLGVGPFHPAASTAGSVSNRIRVTANSGPNPISTALAAAKDGDIIEIAEGIYSDSIRLKSGVTLTGANATLRSSGVAVSADNARNARISGLRIVGGPNSPLVTGISIHGGYVQVEQVEVAGAQKAGIEFTGEADGNIQGCLIHHNGGPGIAIRDHSDPGIQFNLVFSNGFGPGPANPGLWLDVEDPGPVTGNSFLGNAAGAIWSAKPAGIWLTTNEFGPNGARGKASDLRKAPTKP